MVLVGVRSGPVVELVKHHRLLPAPAVHSAVQLDDADWAILRALFRWERQTPRGEWRVSVRELARRSGLAANTAARHLAALRRGGVLEGTFFEPSPKPLGLSRGGIVVEGVKQRGAQAVGQALEGIPSVSVAVVGHSVVLGHVWAQTGGIDEVAQRMRRALGAKRTTIDYNTDRMPPARGDDMRLSGVDRRLVLELRKDPGRSLRDIARGLGVTRRTIERRGARLVAAGVGAMRPRFRPSKAEGRVLVDYFVTRGDKRAPGSLARAFPDALLLGGLHVFIDVANLAEAERRRAQAAAMEGIEEIEAFLVEDLLFPPAFEPWLAGHVANAPPVGTR